MNRCEVFIPLVTGLGLNDRMHWAVRARKVKAERSAAWLCALKFPCVGLPATVTITRIGAKTMDDDNLPGALKAIRDGIADRMGVDDGGNAIAWVYRQERVQGLGMPGVRVLIERRIA